MSLRMAALGLLARRPASGYDLLKKFEVSMANVWPATQSQLYSELNKLAAEGLIEVTAVGARGRKEYGITAAGRDALRDWVLDFQHDPPLRSAALLRVFLLGEVTPEQAGDYLRSVAARAESALARYEDLCDTVPWNDTSDTDFYGRAALEYGLREAAMTAEWARWVAARIEKRSQ
ncbi:transcriptional regulator [Mycolicibacterium parafortuitum]|uniref:Transcriptional regulator n=1 Tax=Mycolicibacterium parafortuitum TaxID=39692 RepID=A0A7I7U0T2_MYCPF|nr:PadR family transcriptional regulator [Mycolicibacterium parafortuitum]BBY75010.1 transcriptional regulator [Mycolicibacterium parafortuitum]